MIRRRHLNTKIESTMPTARNAAHCQKPSDGKIHANEVPLLEKNSHPSQPSTASEQPSGPESKVRSPNPIVTTAAQKMICTSSGMLRNVSM